MIAPEHITGLVLAGGRGTRMGGIDKGLQLFAGVPLALHAARRLAPQVASVVVNANRNLTQYAAFGFEVVGDTLPDHPGPLAGMLAGLESCTTPYLACVPCDSPFFPTDLVARLAQALHRHAAAVAVASAPDAQGVLRRQPVFCLMQRGVEAGLANFLARGDRKIGMWLSEQAGVTVHFDQPADHPKAFANANSLDDLRALE